MEYAMRLLVAMAAGLLAATAFSAEKPGESQTPVQEAAALRADLAAELPLLAGAAVEGPLQSAARDALHAIVVGVHQALQAQVDSKDLEARLRARETQAALLEMVRIKKILSALPPASRAVVLSFYTTNRAGFDGIFAPANLSMGYGPQMLSFPLYDLTREQEPLLAVCLRFGSPPVVRCAAEFLLASDLKSAELVDALTYAVISPVRSEIYPPVGLAYYNPGMGDPWPVCVAALRAMGDSRPVPVLLSAMLRKKPLSMNSYYVDMILSDALAGLGNKSLLPAMMDPLEKAWARQPQTMPVKGSEAVLRPYDAWIDCASRLAGLGSPTAKVLLKNQQQQMRVFKSDQDREGAAARLKEWWGQNKPAAAAARIAPLDLDQWLRQSYFAASGPASAPAAKFDAALAGPLAARARRAAARLVAELGSDRVTRRQAAQQALLGLFEQYLDALVDASHAELARVLLDKAATETIFQSLQAEMSPQLREQLLKAGAAMPRIVDDLFSFERVRNLIAVRALSKLQDKALQPLAEPLLIYCVNHSSSDLSIAACEVAAGGLYSSDELVDALGGILAGSTNVYFNWSQVLFQSAQRYAPSLALDSLKAIHTPRSAATILTAMTGGQTYDVWRWLVLSNALGESGDKSVISALVAGLDGESLAQGGVVRPNGKPLTVTDRDCRLSTALKLTGQKPEDYGMVYTDAPFGAGVQVPRVWGFEKEGDRTAAIRKLKQWWEQNKDKPPYKDLPALPTIKFKKAADSPSRYGVLQFRGG